MSLFLYALISVAQRGQWWLQSEGKAQSSKIQVALLQHSAPSFPGHPKSFAGDCGHLKITVQEINLSLKLGEDAFGTPIINPKAQSASKPCIKKPNQNSKENKSQNKLVNRKFPWCLQGRINSTDSSRIQHFIYRASSPSIGKTSEWEPSTADTLLSPDPQTAPTVFPLCACFTIASKCKRLCKLPASQLLLPSLQVNGKMASMKHFT